MEINKQLFEDVLSGKLKGTFVLRNGEIYFSNDLHRNHNIFRDTHPYATSFGSYTPEGIFPEYKCRSQFDIVDFIPDTNMKENELTIEIPNGKIVDWDESKKQNKIVLKDKQLTYEDVCKKLFSKDCYFIDQDGSVEHISTHNWLTAMDKNNATTEHQLECILAKNKLATVAVYLNDGWKPTSTEDVMCYLSMNLDKHIFVTSSLIRGGCYLSNILFKSKELAEQAIEILGEETVKLALEPLGI